MGKHNGNKTDRYNERKGIQKMAKKIKETIEDKIMILKEQFDGEAIVVSFSCSVDDVIKLEMVMPRRRWNDEPEDPDDNIDSDGPSEITKPNFDMLKGEVNYFG